MCKNLWYFLIMLYLVLQICHIRNQIKILSTELPKTPVFFIIMKAPPSIKAIFASKPAWPEIICSDAVFWEKCFVDLCSVPWTFNFRGTENLRVDSYFATEFPELNSIARSLYLNSKYFQTQFLVVCVRISIIPIWYEQHSHTNYDILLAHSTLM